MSSLKKTQDKEIIFANKKQSGKQYAIPSAFGAYAKYIKEDTKDETVKYCDSML